MSEKMSPHMKLVMSHAVVLAREMGHDAVGSEHLLLAILGMPDCQAYCRLKNLNVSIPELAETLKNRISSPTNAMMMKGELPLTARTRKILDIASLESGKERPMGTVDCVAAILREGESVGADLLFNLGITAEKFLSAGVNEHNHDEQERPEPGEMPEPDELGAKPRKSAARDKRADKTPTIDMYGRDLSAMACRGELDPVIGREVELRRVIQVLCRRTKNNVVLIGEAGVGKTAVVEGLAQAIYRGDVPERMQNRRVVALDIARIVAGTQYRGQFEERLKNIIDEVRRAKNIILFLDEIHTMVGAGGSEGAMDAANILKPALARGELQCVGATTLKEYHKSIEKDAALERRFQSVIIDEPTANDTIEILKGIVSKYESFHAVKYSDGAIKAAVELTKRYLPTRQLPDKAIDAIDETAARLRMSASRRPAEINNLQKELTALQAQKSEAVENNDFDEAARLRDLCQTQRRVLEEKLNAWRQVQNEVQIEVKDSDIAETVALMSGVPVEKLTQMETQRLLGLEKQLGEIVIGQNEAIAAIAKALRRSRVFQLNNKRPIGSFLFLGPTGVGKTYLAKMLAEHVYGDEKALITIDMSEFQEKYSSSRLVGSPPGYVGYDEGGQLTERVRRRPYSVVLFDEFEKANADVLNMLLQILDDGRLTDGQGRQVDFRNTIIICTANLGFDFARAGNQLGFATETASTAYEVLKTKLLDEAKKTFRPELLNRFDDLIVFRKLDRQVIEKILDLELARVKESLKAKGTSLTLDKKALAFLVEKGYDDQLGARPLRRVVQRYLEDPVAELCLMGTLPARVRGRLSKDGQSITFKK